MNPPLERARFALKPGLVYLNHAAVGVLPIVTRNALHAAVSAHAEGGLAGMWPYEQKLPAYRRRIAAFINGHGDEIALLRNTGDGATILAQGLGLQAGDEIVGAANEFGSNAYPWLVLRERGVHVRLIDAPRERMTPDVLRRTMTPRTKVVTVSWVTFDDGYRHDLTALAEVAHAGGAVFAVDVMQALGAFGLDVRATGVDAVYAGAAKWLMGLQGVSFLWLRSSLLDRVAVALPGWRSPSDMWEFLDYEQGYARTASRYEGGTPNVIGALSLATSMDVLEEAGLDRIAAHVVALTDRVAEGAAARGYAVLGDRSRDDVKSGIVTISKEGVDPIALGRRLGEAGVNVTYRANGIRISPHGHNSFDDIDALLSAL